ncbi:Endonuclease/exonuclease/phosphatase [Paraphysoderma sedebokerense]|nr:Endonuclease/exonuclease/phosphatase [Paraphysoderma sedebokerense]KAI9137896.1 Endonuclease/exonuclease/phosphatase [Paraphysoderma sedebokerense]KAI9137904.1 Endonuclease/exonuclease/phosphatase [Paraphysoderma sedebokerense]KAI9139024.1 Endonuclease/exonuclease/phosphatase [Paraphysoderma sedebokerense]
MERHDSFLLALFWKLVTSIISNSKYLSLYPGLFFPSSFVTLRARAAAALARSTGNFNVGTSYDPNAPTGVNAASQSNLKKESESRWTTLDIGGMGIKSLSQELFRYNFLTTLYLNHNNLTFIPPEISKLRALVLLDVSGNKLTSLPPEIGLLASLQSLLFFDNGISTLPWQVGNLYQCECLGMEGNPMTDPIVSLMQKEGTSAVITYLRDHAPIPTGPKEREWIIMETEVPTAPSETCAIFCYNILSEKYASPKMYGYTPSWALSWETRRENVKSEIIAFSPDIICLQEVEMCQYDDYFKPRMMEEGGYDSVFWPKSRARTMTEWERKSVDGCATFFRTSRYTLIEKHLIEFNQIALRRPDFHKSEDVYNRLMTKDNIAVVTLLENKETGTRMLVANCHIHWDPTYRDVKLVQVAMLMEELEKLALEYSPSDSDVNYTGPIRLPTLICGDFNSTPDSGVYELLSHGTVPQDHDDFGSFTYGPYTTEGLSHKLSLKSSYQDVKLEFTNFTPTFSGVIDYIWYTNNTMNVIGLLGGIDKSYTDKCVGFPNAHFPSDHIPILAEFRVTPPSQQNGNNKNQNQRRQFGNRK